MKRIVFGIIYAVAALLWVACSREEAIPKIEDGSATDKVILNITSGKETVSRASTVEDNGVETRMRHLDVLVFEESGAYVHHERVAVNGDGDGKIILAVKRSVFSKDRKYFVYLLANSTLDAGVFKDKTLAEIKILKQKDQRIHMTGNPDIQEAPDCFLMDGCAYVKGGTEPQSPTAIPLTDGVEANNTELNVVLRRAAAKIVVTIKQGEKVEFDRNLGTEGYYLMNMAYDTPLLGEVEVTDAELRTPDLTAGSYFNWATDNTITVTAYSYSNFWEDKPLDRETCLVVNIPLREKNDESKEYSNSYYKIPLSEAKRLDRNTYYGVTVTVNAPGAANMNKPLTLDDISYDVRPWTEKVINVGGETDRPKYLTVNTDSVEMINIADDNTTLHFASSADVTVDVDEVYYIDKFGQRQTVRNHGVTAVPTGDLTGNIKLHSPVPTNNTIRYIKLTVWNRTDNLSHEVIVAQYPLEYITNIQSWYSYRDDFKTGNNPPTTYEYKGDRIAGVSLEIENIGSWLKPEYVWAGRYEYNTASDGFWRSKVADEPKASGMSDISYYYYNRSGRLQEKSAQSDGNARMYHIQLTSSSDEYTVGRPRMNSEGFTDAGADNAKLVSPSFMIASRLGFLNTDAGNLPSADTDEEKLRVFREHCKQYVEVYKDPKTGKKIVLDDWRLPTEAEINIIIKFQGTSSQQADAIDYLLNAKYYMSASGPVLNSKNNTSGTSVRCIRDAYVSGKAKVNKQRN